MCKHLFMVRQRNCKVLFRKKLLSPPAAISEAESESESGSLNNKFNHTTTSIIRIMYNSKVLRYTNMNSACSSGVAYS